jgi:hypothetical protein
MSGNSALKAEPWTPSPPRDTASDTTTPNTWIKRGRIILQRTKNVLSFSPEIGGQMEDSFAVRIKCKRTIYAARKGE